MQKVLLNGKRFVLESGEELILHGINVLCRERTNNHFYPGFEKAFTFFKHMGFNLIRLGIFWDGAEPEPGKIDEEYLAKVKSIVSEAENNGIYIMLDMHQDLFAQKFIDGAPDWACLDEGLPHPDNCKLWYEAYLTSEAIIRAADNFWANTKAADGLGLLDHYGMMWERIAEVFDDCTNVIGFEPMNEPFMGSLAREAFGAATMAMRQINPGFDISKPETIPPEQTVAFMGHVAQRLIDFDKTTLMDFYRRMQAAIQKHSDKPIVTGGNIYCSTNVPTGIERLEGIGQIYAPHGYDSVVDSDRYESFSKENVERIYSDKRASQDRLGLPCIASEWGAFPSRAFTNDLIRHMNGIVEKNLWGSAYCEYRPGMEKDANFTALRRSYPLVTAGVLEAYHYSEADRNLSVSFKACKDGQSRFFVPFHVVSVQSNLPVEWKIEDDICVIKVLQDGETTIVIQG